MFDILGLSNNLKNVLYGKVFDEDNYDHGGRKCVESMSFQFRLIVTLLTSLVYYSLYKYRFKNLQIEINSNLKSIEESSLLEKFFGWTSISVFFIIFVYKVISHQLIFMLNPCHLTILIQAYLLINQNKLTQQIIYVMMMNNIFSPLVGIVFSQTTGMHLPLEICMFWIEHFLAGIINPLILSLSERYYSNKTLSFQNHLLAHSYFGILMRLILFPMSWITDANINNTLCAAAHDPFAKILGKWYYTLSDLYIFACAEIINKAIKIILDVFRKLKFIVCMFLFNQPKDDHKSS